ncbi:DNA-processing protein DprA [Actinopolyspora mortivallis]|uniref:DNA-protecting protein DprA n=1 Tax=Actinopolyspora mortivallis TaxID=33906 RepID=A0A2T0GTU7_ACTMO|nr:DNA-processing protein DprA [Actinopolyspora mortivallis]PRW62545.1 DNA-protecting protein DprA [Actinopolyspora mortivallis]
MNAGSVPDEQTLVARAYLCAVAEPPAPALSRFTAERGPVEAAEAVYEGDVDRAVGREVEARRTRVSGRKLLELARREGVRLLVPEHPEWPVGSMEALAGATSVGLEGLAEPLALWCRGAGETNLSSRFVSIVGTRAATGYGESLAAELAYGVASAGVGVVSGAAHGVDGAAHRGALAARGRTVAVLACGPERDYPASHARLLGEIAERGVVLSEYPPGVLPRKHRFLVRNRLIAALGRATVVVEAGARSGAANTAAAADSLGCPVMAVPGPVTSASSVGCHELIRSGRGILVTGADEVLEAVVGLGEGDDPSRQTRHRATDRLDTTSRVVCDALRSDRPRQTEQLALETGFPERTVLACLNALEMSGFARFADEGWTRCE